MAKDKELEAVSSYLMGLSLLEEKVAEVYDFLGGKVAKPFIRSQLLGIARDSKKHAELLKGISETLVNQRLKLKNAKKNFQQCGIR
jgi:rubrerythrin